MGLVSVNRTCSASGHGKTGNWKSIKIVQITCDAATVFCLIAALQAAMKMFTFFVRFTSVTSYGFFVNGNCSLYLLLPVASSNQ